MAWATGNAAAGAEQLVNDALRSRKAELGLSSYELPELGWVIRNHLIDLVSEFPTFLPSVNAFTHEDGRKNVLVNAKGRLPVPSFIPLPPLHLALWLPRRYPLDPPLAFLTSPGPDDAALSHPYLDPTSGEANAVPYLTSWEFPLSNLAELVRSLATAFERYPPFPALCSPRGLIVFRREEYCEGEDHLALALVDAEQQQRVLSREDALDELASRVHEDLQLVSAEALEAADLAARMRKRWCHVSRAVFDLGCETRALKAAVQEMSEHADVLRNWVRANDTQMFPAESPEDVFEPADAEASAESWLSWNLLAMEGFFGAIEDLLMSLDEALKERLVVSVQEYLKQVKNHAREQFFFRAEANKVERGIKNRGNIVESVSGGVQQTKPPKPDT